MRIKRLITGLTASVLGFSSLLTIGLTPLASAAGQTCTWTGATDLNFSTATNWSGCGGSTPTSGDDLVFDNTSLSDVVTLNNDMSGLVVGTISFTGTGVNYFAITGNGITINSGITENSAEASELDVDITLGGDATFSMAQSGVYIGSSDGSNSLDTAGHNLTISSTASDAEAYFYSPLVGSGNFVVNVLGELVLSSASPSYSGAVTVSGGTLVLYSTTALGTTSGVTIGNGGALYLDGDTDSTYNFPLTLNGNGATGDYASPTLSSSSSHGGGLIVPKTVTLSGSVTLQSDVTFGGSNNIVVTGTYTPNGHKFVVQPGVLGAITTSDGTLSAQPVTTTIASTDKQASKVESVGNKVTLVLDGERGDVYVTQGGTLKGSGKVGDLSISQGGTVAPGHSPGCLSSGNYSQSGVYQAEIGGTTACSGYDQLQVTGTVNLDSSSTLEAPLYGGFKPAVGQSYTIISNDGTDAVTGTFSGLAEGASYTNDGVTYTVTYKGGDGNDVVLTVTKVDTSALPATPDTGMRLVSAHPMVALAVSALAAAILFVTARKLRPVTRKR